MSMTFYQEIIIGYFVVINPITYIVMCFDKYQSKKNGMRVSEKKLFFLAISLGTLGIYLGMKAPVYHKAAKSKFKWGIPLILFIQIILLLFLLIHLQ